MAPGVRASISIKTRGSHHGLRLLESLSRYLSKGSIRIQRSLSIPPRHPSSSTRKSESNYFRACRHNRPRHPQEAPYLLQRPYYRAASKKRSYRRPKESHGYSFRTHRRRGGGSSNIECYNRDYRRKLF